MITTLVEREWEQAKNISSSIATAAKDYKQQEQEQWTQSTEMIMMLCHISAALADKTTGRLA